MKPRKNPDMTLINECFKYIPETGDLFWKERPAHHFASSGVARLWNKRFANKKAGCAYSRKGRRIAVTINLNGGYSAHRIIWEMFNDPIPDGLVIDHIDGNPWNNRMDNLRVASYSQNLMNKDVRKSNPTGFKGVFQRSGNRKFIARIGIDGKSIYIGSFSNPEDANAAYVEMAKKIHGRFARVKNTDSTTHAL